jgi:hypothetical protein
VALATAQRHLYRPRPDTDVAHLHGRSSAPASRESVACRRSGVKRALHDDEQKPIRRLLLLRETGTLGRRVARISRAGLDEQQQSGPTTKLATIAALLPCMDRSGRRPGRHGCRRQAKRERHPASSAPKGVGGSAVEAGGFVPGGKHVHDQRERPLTATGGGGIVAR